MASVTMGTLQAQYAALVEQRKASLAEYKRVVAEAKARNAEIKALEQQIREARRDASLAHKQTIQPDDDLAFFWKRTALPPKGTERYREMKRRDHLARLLWSAFLKANSNSRYGSDDVSGFKGWAQNTHLHEINRLLSIPRGVNTAYYQLRIYDRRLSLGEYARMIEADG